MSVLIVDDAEDSREMYADYLRFKGHTVETEKNGRDGLARALAAPPDAAVLDLTMPGIDGYDVIRALRADARTSRVLIIVVSGHAMTGVESRVYEAGADVFLAKPCLPEALEAVVARGRRP